MTAEQLNTFCNAIDALERQLDAAEEAARKFYHAQTGDADGLPLEALRDLALQAANVNEGGELRMLLVRLTRDA